jgi:Transglutaminase-like superfamily
MGLAAKLIKLERRDRALAIIAGRTLAMTWVGLRTVGFKALSARASRVAGQGTRAHSWCGPPPRRTVAPPTIERIAWAVRAAGRFIPGGTNCLVRALATQLLLGQYGYRSELRIGVRKAEDGALAAHAWLESAGAIVIGEFELEHYVPLAAPGSRQPSSAT